MCPPLLALLPAIGGGTAAAGTAAAAGAGAAAAGAAAAGTAATAATTAMTTAQTIGMIASIGSTLMGMDAQNDMAEQNAKSANEAKIIQDQQINLQEAQADERAATEKIARNEQVAEAQARATVAGGESGGVLNNDAVQQSMTRQGLVANSMTSQNLGRERAQFGMDRLAARSSAQSRINSVSRASNTAGALKIGADVANYYA